MPATSKAAAAKAANGARASASPPGPGVRAEFPPAHYWRGWADDAPAPDFPDPNADAPPDAPPEAPPQGRHAAGNASASRYGVQALVERPLGGVDLIQDTLVQQAAGKLDVTFQRSVL